MRSAVAALIVATLSIFCFDNGLLGQPPTTAPAKQPARPATTAPAKPPPRQAPPVPAAPPQVAPPVGAKEEPAAEVPEPKFDQKAADFETLKSADIPARDPKALIEFFQKHTGSDAARTKLDELIRQLADDDFDRREDASNQIEHFGVTAIGVLRRAERSPNPEVMRRCEICLKNIEKVPTRVLVSAAARTLGELKGEGACEALINYLPLAEDDSVGDDVRGALAALAMKDGVPDAFFKKTLESKDALKRGAAAEALARSGDKTVRAEMRQVMSKENDVDTKLRIAVALVSYARDKAVIEDMIKIMADAPAEASWRAEEILIRLAEEKGPSISLGSDHASREKARDEWLKWWSANEKTVNMAKLDDMERTLGFTLIIEMDMRNINGRVKEIGPDGKVRWEVTNVQMPTDAIVLPGNRVMIAEQNGNRVSERDIANGKEIWSANINQPVGLQRLSNGHVVMISRNQVIEWDRAHNAVSTITRNQFDIVSGAKLRNGNFAIYTNQGQMVVYDKTQKEIDHFAAGRGNYFSTMQVMPNGKVLITQLRGIAEVDFANKKVDVVMNYNFPTSAQKLANGNILVSNQNSFQVLEMDPRTNKTVWEYKPDNNNNIYRPWRAKRR